MDTKGNPAEVEGITVYDFGADALITRQGSFLTMLDALRILIPRRQG